LGVWEDLEWEGVKGALKVIIVSFLYLILWVSELCNNFNIVSGEQDEKEENLLALTSIITAFGIIKCETIKCKSLELVECVKNT